VDQAVNALKPGGWFGLACFRPEGGSGYSDNDVYVHRSLGGGLGYAEERLRDMWSGRLRVSVACTRSSGFAVSALLSATTVATGGGAQPVAHMCRCPVLRARRGWRLRRVRGRRT